MGLDVYLKKCTDLDTERAKENKADEMANKLWEDAGEFSSLSSEQQDAVRAQIEKIYSDLGLDEWGSSKSITTLNQDSTIDPDHMFKLGYFRSSYNSAGINWYLRNLGMNDLHDLFEPNDDYDFKPNWHEALKRTDHLIQAYELYLQSPQAKYVAIEIAANPYAGENGINNEKSAIDAFVEKTKGRSEDSGFSSFGCNLGDFYLSGIKLVAVIPRDKSVKDPFSRGQVFYAIVEKEKTDEKDWYLTALQIVKETITYVLNQPDSEAYFLSWSG